MLVIAVLFAAGATAFAFLVGRPKGGNSRKLSPYECGMEPMPNTRERFPVKFYLVAMLFILFDIEVIFLYPWAVVFKQLAVFGLVEMGIFLAILLVGYIYAWRVGALEWQ